MPESLAQHADLIWGAALLLAILWLATRVFGRKKLALGDEMQLRVYCTHCNWEGTVTRAAMACRRCQSKHVSVLAA